MSRRSAGAKARGLPVVLVAVVLLVSGCGTTRSGAAAIVGDQRITTSQLTTTADEVERERAAGSKRSPASAQPDRAATNRRTLSAEITSVLFQELARREGVTLSKGELDRFYQQIDKSQGLASLQAQALQADVPKEDIDRDVRVFLLRAKIGEQLVPGTGQQVEQQRSTALNAAVSKLSRQLGVTVSPRFGRWDAKTASVLPPEDGLATPATPTRSGASPSP